MIHLKSEERLFDLIDFLDVLYGDFPPSLEGRMFDT